MFSGSKYSMKRVLTKTLAGDDSYFTLYLKSMNSHHPDISTLVAGLPAEKKEDLFPSIRRAFEDSHKTIVVLDDDPTGTQTCYDVMVLTSWTVPLLVEELTKKPSIIFILTNSRSLSEVAAIALAQQIGSNLVTATKQSGRDIVVISRSDSTLRGHFPAEVDAVAGALQIVDAVRVLIPAFIEGGRLTLDDVHYIVERNKLQPVADTPFAADKVFGYKNSNLKAWVEEKSKGAIKASQVVSVTLDDIRVGGVDAVHARLLTCLPGQVCIVNAWSHKDLEVVVMGLIKAETSGQKFIYRTSATFVPMRAGVPSGKLYVPTRKEAQTQNGSLVVAGSYVPKTTKQLENLLGEGGHEALEVDVQKLLNGGTNAAYSESIALAADRWISNGKHVVIYTSRDLHTAPDVAGNLRIHQMVSDFLVGLLKNMKQRPAFIVAKGGITSSDLATRALNARRALILGQVIPGVPVWKMDEQSRFPGLIYVVFPGNVGDDNALKDVCMKMMRTS